MTTQDWTSWMLQTGPAWFRAHWGSRFIGSAIGIPSDVVADAIVSAGAVGTFRSPSAPDGTHRKVGEERGLTRYPGETLADYRARLADAWNIYARSGSPTEMTNQLATAGFPYCMIQWDFDAYAGDIDRGVDAYPSSADYWSSFIVVVPYVGYTDELDDSYTWDEAEALGYVWDGYPTLYWDSPSNITNRESLRVVRSIIKKWKPVDWICRAIVVLPPDVTDIYLDNPAYLTDSSSLWGLTGVEYHRST